MKGKLVAKDGTATLAVELSGAEKYNAGGWDVILVGDGTRRRYFSADKWELVEDNPSLYEQVQALPVGTKFRTANKSRTYIRLQGDDVHYWYDGDTHGFTQNADRTYWGNGNVVVVK